MGIGRLYITAFPGGLIMVYGKIFSINSDEDADMEWLLIDSTIVHAHQHSAVAKISDIYVMQPVSGNQ
jgi:hypothetical protein